MKLLPRFGLPQGLQRDNGSSFKAVVTQGVSKVLGIECHLEIPNLFGKVEKPPKTLIKRHQHKLTQETQDNCLKVHP